jgi:hypothetical protein
MTRFRLIVASVILAVWVATLILDAVSSTYAIPPTVHGLMVMVAGYLFGPAIAGRRKDD